MVEDSKIPLITLLWNRDTVCLVSSRPLSRSIDEARTANQTDIVHVGHEEGYRSTIVAGLRDVVAYPMEKVAICEEFVE